MLIVLLSAGLGYSLSRENSFVLDFSHQDEIERMQAEIERLQEEAAFKEAISRKIQEQLGGDVALPAQAQASGVRNIAVDRGALRDDRGTDAEQLYADAERLRQELLQGSPIEDDDYAVPAPENPSTAAEAESEVQESVYTGPSVVEYELAGRKASRLSIPAYRCLGGHRRPDRRVRLLDRPLPARLRNPRRQSLPVLRQTRRRPQAKRLHSLPVHRAMSDRIR